MSKTKTKSKFDNKKNKPASNKVKKLPIDNIIRIFLKIILKLKFNNKINKINKIKNKIIEK